MKCRRHFFILLSVMQEFFTGPEYVLSGTSCFPGFVQLAVKYIPVKSFSSESISSCHHGFLPVDNCEVCVLIMLTRHLQIILRKNMFICAGNHLFLHERGECARNRTGPWAEGRIKPAGSLCDTCVPQLLLCCACDQKSHFRNIL